MSDPAITFSTVNVGGFLRLVQCDRCGSLLAQLPAGQPACQPRNNTTPTSITSTTVSCRRSLGSVRRWPRTNQRPALLH